LPWPRRLADDAADEASLPLLMHFQVIHCHPLADSYNHALFETIVGALEAGGHQVTATDLYRDGFDPAMTAAERQSYYHDPYDAAAVARYTQLLGQIDGMVLCFPHWWFAMPAVLKGYFDRVWGPGIAFAHDLAGGRIRGLLTNIKVFGVVTTYGSPWWITRLTAGDPGRKVLMRALKPMCGPRVQSFYLAHYDMDRSTPRSRGAFLDRVRRVVAKL
jgi:NAD(P)H dehydrogenase (quinone)